MFKHVLFSERKDGTYLWFTLYPESTILNPRTMAQICQTRSALCAYAEAVWSWTDEEKALIEHSKIDIAVDMEGSFIPTSDKPVFKKIEELLSQSIIKIFNDQSLNFLSLHNINDLKVTKGDNNLETCYQYAILNEEREKVLNIKFYDKMLDLCSRDGIQKVGTRIDHILGSSGKLDTFYKRVCQAQETGMTRLEISICHPALQ